MNITPSLSGLVSSAVNRGYSVNVRENIIRIKISDNETINIVQYHNGDVQCSLSKHGIVQAIAKTFVYNFLFTHSELIKGDYHG